MLRESSVLALLAWISTAAAADPGDFAAERPGQTTPTSVMPAGRLMFESALLSWSRQSDGDEAQNELILGDHLLRGGVGAHTELQLGWRMLSRSTGTATGTGDLSFGVLHNFSALDGPLAVQAFVTLPTGQASVSQGDWSAGLRLPIAVALGDTWSLGVTPELDAAVNASGRGRHAAFGGAVGIGRALAEHLSTSVDLSLFRDQDPDGNTSRAVTSATLAWQAGADTQLDLGLATGLNRDSIDFQVYFGVARRL